MQPAGLPRSPGCITCLPQAEFLSLESTSLNILCFFARARLCSKRVSRPAAKRARTRRRGLARCTSARRSSPKATSTTSSIRTTIWTLTKSKRVSKSTQRASTSPTRPTPAGTPLTARSRRISSEAKDEFISRRILTWSSFQSASPGS